MDQNWKFRPPIIQRHHGHSIFHVCTVFGLGFISAWKKHTGPSSNPYHLCRKWLSTTRQNRSCLPRLECRILHCVAQRPLNKIIQSSTMLGRQSHGPAIGTTAISCPHGDISSSWRTQKNGLPQGSVLAPTLFNVCIINDLPATTCRKFIKRFLCNIIV